MRWMDGCLGGESMILPYIVGLCADLVESKRGIMMWTDLKMGTSDCRVEKVMDTYTRSSQSMSLKEFIPDDTFLI
jgi:hypothetical protein